MEKHLEETAVGKGSGSPELTGFSLKAAKGMRHHLSDGGDEELGQGWADQAWGGGGGDSL